MKYILISLVINSINGPNIEFGPPSGAWGPFDDQKSCEAVIDKLSYPNGKMLCLPMQEPLGAR